ncbi:protein of unknown function DUF815 [Desulfofarcimen acetoxidans DSM 771]|uniref:AAA+ ATPase domain-containing protein n=1 Tax=Desulfofarcimen acetoxidans (strain ATCC 49208 / DSM 771 / KCTC 5769 / VKM B-1644 / 5575) TaxID=485916 RepID=C8W2K9_DESAS|nr:ATP-binding protein [Desulfofarcimen acetoxidans]ACV63693.1 protein of unknown function DUF815 [Desulfofarcimen acetoxidans DSM 771]
MQDKILINEAISAAKCLFIYSNISEQPVICAFRELLESLAGRPVSVPKVLQKYYKVFGLLAGSQEKMNTGDVMGDAWQDYLLEAVLADENVFSRKAEAAGIGGMGESLKKAVMADLNNLQLLWKLDSGIINRAVSDILGIADGKTREDIDRNINLDCSDTEVSAVRALPAWDCFESLSNKKEIAFLSSLDINVPKLRNNIKKSLSSSADWSEQLEQLANYYAAAGSGILSKYMAFRWVKKGQEGYLTGVEEPDQISFQELVGNHEELREVIKNTEMFLLGYPANNVLLYGDRGTGKSSTVKALLNKYFTRGLKLIEVPRNALTDFPEIIALLRRRAGRFILFVDDLSFEDHEVEYKDMKAVLEGGIEVKPDNVLLYATSNRRHLVREYFADRKLASDEVRMSDSVQEKLSLADRFGITVVFTTPDQKRYLEIAEGLALQKGLEIEREDLRRRALQWEMWHNGRSGRTARQFIDHLAGELAIENKL